jgi:tRNA-specific 2-thiouridylase
MSGGVDSSVAAALMLDQGHEVVGATLKQWEGPDGSLPLNGCCTVADAEDARRAASTLGIRHYVLDYVEEFNERVVDPFAAAYLEGRTPNPCIECNRRVRFRALLDRATELGCDVLVTGHHARIREDEQGFHLLKAADPAKDQSYVLHMLSQDDLSRIRFPVGEMTKDEVRADAARRGMRTANKPDSQDLCFIAHDHRSFLMERFPEIAEPGPIVDASGAEVGRHEGAVGYTIGQRRGLNLAMGEPRYVLDVQPATATVVIGTREDLLVDGVRVAAMSWIAGSPPDDPGVMVKTRYRSAPVPARLQHVADDEWEIWTESPQEAAAAGQAAVVYRGDEVLGGGTIEGTLRR